MEGERQKGGKTREEFKDISVEVIGSGSSAVWPSETIHEALTGTSFTKGMLDAAAYHDNLVAQALDEYISEMCDENGEISEELFEKWISSVFDFEKMEPKAFDIEAVGGGEGEQESDLEISAGGTAYV